MKKIIFLFTAIACFLTIEAQTITKVLGQINTRPTLVDLETDTIFLDKAFLNTLIWFGFEFKNGNIQLSAGDTIIIRGNIGTVKFPIDDDDLDNQ